MANYKIIGNMPVEKLFGSKENAEKVLKAMNICKEIGVRLGAEFDPPYIWNKNLPNSWTRIIGDRVMNKIMKDKDWKPDEAFVDEIRKEVKKK